MEGHQCQDEGPSGIPDQFIKLYFASADLPELAHILWIVMQCVSLLSPRCFFGQASVFNTDKTLLVVIFFEEFPLAPERLTNSATVSDKAFRSSQLLYNFAM